MALRTPERAVRDPWSAGAKSGYVVVRPAELGEKIGRTARELSALADDTAIEFLAEVDLLPGTAVEVEAPSHGPRAGIRHEVGAVTDVAPAQPLRSSVLAAAASSDPDQHRAARLGSGLVARDAAIPALLAAAASAISPVFAQAYPAKPVRIIVPFPAGGSVDAVTDDEIRAGIKLLAETTGIFTETAGGVTTAVLAVGRTVLLQPLRVTSPEDLEDEVTSWYRDLLALEEMEKPSGTRARGAWFRMVSYRFT